MNIDMEEVKKTENTSEKLDAEILKGMMELNPAIKILYMNKVIEQKDEEIRRLQNVIAEMKRQQVNDRVEKIVMMYEIGIPYKLAILKEKEGIL